MKVKFNSDIAFLLLLLFGIFAYIILHYIETRPYEGEISVIEGVVQKNVFVSGGTMTGKSFTRVYLDDGKTYRLPFGEMLPFKKGDRVSLSIPKGHEYDKDNDIIVVKYDTLE